MARVRRAAAAAAILILSLGSIAAAAGPPGRPVALVGSSVSRLTAVPWPTSGSLLLAEVVTGGASASDEYVELTNASSSTLDLAGLELVYVTSTGSTVTRKATWSSSQPLDPGRHLLVANASGTFAGIADATYSGGFAATGGSLALRPVGGTAIDSVGWGDATNAFVEGTAAPAPPAGSSLERRPGGPAGNTDDTNDNVTDWAVVGTPVPQNVLSPAVPGPGPTPAPTVSPGPTPTPTPTPSPTPTPKPTPGAVSIAVARRLADGSAVAIDGVVTAGLGSLESGHGGFVQDATGGIAVYLDAPATTVFAAGTAVRLAGTVDDRYAQRTLRVAESDVEVVSPAPLPVPVDLPSGGIGESVEGIRVAVLGTVVEAPTAYADGLGMLVDDGSGPVRAIVAPAALGSAAPGRGDIVSVVGPIGQRDSSGTGAEGYRLLATNPGDFVSILLPSPSPTPTPTSSLAPTPSPTPGATPTAVPTPGPTPTPAAPSIASVRALPVGTLVTVDGVVTATAADFGGTALLAVGDEGGGIFVRLTDGVAAPARGSRVMVTGKTADPYGQLEIRPAVGGVVAAADAPPLPVAVGVSAADLGEATEGRLAVLTGTVEHAPTKTTDGGLAVWVVDDTGGRARVMVAGGRGLGTADLVARHRYRLTGIVGQRASRKGALDGYRLWLRDRGDVTHLAGPAPTPSPTSTPGSGDAPPDDVSIAQAIGLQGRTVSADGVVTVPASLLDTTGRRIVIQDTTGAVEVLIPTGAEAPPPGHRIRVVGEVGRAYDAPRIRASTLTDLGPAPMPAPHALTGTPTVALEWRLVRIAGTVMDVHKLGDRWRAELAVGSARVVAQGLTGARIPSTSLVVGRRVTIVGIVRRPYPGAADRRFAVEPRGPADVALGGAPGGGVAGGAPGRSGDPGSVEADGSGEASRPSTPPSVELIGLAEHSGERVRVAGLVVGLTPTGLTLDDGTATAAITLTGDAAAYLGLIEPGDALELSGRVDPGDPSGPRLVVSDTADLVRVGDPGDPQATQAANAAETPETLLAVRNERSETIARSAILGGGFPEPTVAGAGWLAGVALLSVAVTVVRRRRRRRAEAARIAARLVRLAGPRGLP
jgi:Lamin Tail Domain